MLVTASRASAQTVEFRVLGWNGPISDLHYESEGKSLPLNAVENGLSQPYHFKGAATLDLYREEKHGDKTVRIPAATLPIPAGLKQAILVLAPANADKHTCEGIWLDDSMEARPVNCLSFFNLSHLPVAIKAGADDIHLAPQEKSRLLPFDLKAHSIPMKVAVNPGTGWEIVFSEPQSVHAGLRILILFRDGRADSFGNRTPVDFVKLYDYVPPSPQP